MSGKSRRFSTTVVSHFWAVACSSAFCSTVLRPPSNCRHTGTKPLYIVIAMRRSPCGVRLRAILARVAEETSHTVGSLPFRGGSRQRELLLVVLDHLLALCLR